MEMGDVSELAATLDGVRQTAAGELVQWRYHGRLIARQLDEAHIVIRADFDYRDAMLRQFPATFSVPSRFEKHMMVVADLTIADVGVLEDALAAAWELQQRSTEPGSETGGPAARSATP